MLRKFLGLSFQFTFTVIGIFMIGSLQYLFFKENEMESMKAILEMLRSGQLWNTSFLGHNLGFNVSAYFSHIYDTLTNMTQLLETKYYAQGDYHPLFPEIIEKYTYSMKILFGALGLGLLAAVVCTFFIMLLSSRNRKRVSSVLFIFESLPDIFVILMLQTLILEIYAGTGVKLMDIYSGSENQVYLLPILCLSILPTVFLIKHLVHLFEDESEKNYVEFAKGKGLRKSSVLLVHILRNTLVILFYQFKTIFWFAFSNLLVLENIFLIKGFTWFLMEHAITPHILTIGLLMVFVPFFIVFSLVRILLEKGGVVQHGSETF